MKAVTAMTVVAAILGCALSAAAAPPESERAAPALRDRPVKPTGPIAVEYDVPTPPAVGVPLKIDVKARVEPDVNGLTIEASASAPRALLITAPELVTATNGVYVWTITVVPLAAEAGYLNVIVAGRIDGVPQARGITVPLHGAPGEGPAPVAAAQGREALIALPVHETP
jgi:hypothetical protein